MHNELIVSLSLYSVLNVRRPSLWLWHLSEPSFEALLRTGIITLTITVPLVIIPDLIVTKTTPLAASTPARRHVTHNFSYFLSQAKNIIFWNKSGYWLSSLKTKTNITKYLWSHSNLTEIFQRAEAEVGWSVTGWKHREVSQITAEAGQGPRQELWPLCAVSCAQFAKLDCDCLKISSHYNPSMLLKYLPGSKITKSSQLQQQGLAGIMECTLSTGK